MSSALTVTDNKPAEVLLIGLGAVGIICEALSVPCSIDKLMVPVDAYLLEKQKLARVTCVARPKKFARLQGITAKPQKGHILKHWLYRERD